MSEKFTNKRILILASKLGYQTRAFAEAAKKLGVAVVFGTDRCHKLDDPWEDGAMALHFEQPEGAAREIAASLRENRVDAILALGDAPTVAAAGAADALGLSCNSAASVATCKNKLRQRETLRAAGVRVPDFWRLREGMDARVFAAGIAYPCVVKPVALAASQGVIRANDVAEFVAAVARIRALLETPELRVGRPGAGRGELIVERYIAGTEVAVEGLITDGVLEILAIFDKPDALEGPFFEESVYVTPSRLTGAQQAEIARCAAAAVAALGLRTGPIHAEFRVNEEGAWVLEVAPRPVGGLCSRALRFGEEKMSLEEVLIRHVLGDRGVSRLERENEASAVMMIPVPHSGVLNAVEGIEAAQQVRYVTGIEITARLKDYIAAWPEGASYLGFIFARADLPEKAERAVREAHAKLRFDLGVRLPVEHPVTGKMTAG